MQSAVNFYPRPPRGGRPFLLLSLAQDTIFLSTPSARRATIGKVPDLTDKLISIHALREEGDGSSVVGLPPFYYFYPRPPRGGRLYLNDSLTNYRNFYPRPPRGGRRFVCAVSVVIGIFLSTPSARRATLSVQVNSIFKIISIHALREEGDAFPASPSRRTVYFYPRPPRGGRPYIGLYCI